MTTDPDEGPAFDRELSDLEALGSSEGFAEELASLDVPDTGGESE